MAVLTGIVETGSPAVICSMSASPLTGMVPMYALMSVFHAGLCSAGSPGRLKRKKPSAALPGGLRVSRRRGVEVSSPWP
jgi:hypothetical protein